MTLVLEILGGGKQKSVQGRQQLVPWPQPLVGFVRYLHTYPYADCCFRPCDCSCRFPKRRACLLARASELARCSLDGKKKGRRNHHCGCHKHKHHAYHIVATRPMFNPRTLHCGSFLLRAAGRWISAHCDVCVGIPPLARAMLSWIKVSLVNAASLCIHVHVSAHVCGFFFPR